MFVIYSYFDNIVNLIVIQPRVRIQGRFVTNPLIPLPDKQYAKNLNRSNNSAPFNIKRAIQPA